jgi:hypothetical protein
MVLIYEPKDAERKIEGKPNAAPDGSCPRCRAILRTSQYKYEVFMKDDRGKKGSYLGKGHIHKCQNCGQIYHRYISARSFSWDDIDPPEFTRA